MFCRKQKSSSGGDLWKQETSSGECELSSQKEEIM